MGPCDEQGLGPTGGGILWAKMHHNCTLHLWNVRVPLGDAPSRVVRTEEPQSHVLAEKCAFHDFVSSSCTSGNKGTGVEHGCTSHSDPRNQSSSCKHLGQGGGSHSSLMLTVSQKSRAASLASDSAWAFTPESGRPGESSASEGNSSPSNAAIESSSSSGAPNEILNSL